MEPEPEAVAVAMAVAQLGPEPAHVPETRAVALMLIGASRLGELILDTEVSHTMLAISIVRLREATHDAEKLADYAFDLVLAGMAPLLHLEAAVKLFTAGMFEGSLPGSIDAARRIVGHLSGALPTPAAYLQISESQRNLEGLGSIFANACYHFWMCAVLLGFTQDGAQWQRWTSLTLFGSAQWSEANVRLAAADEHALEAHWILYNLCNSWGIKSGVDRTLDLLSAEENLHDARILMEDALIRMREMHGAVMRQFFQAWTTVQHQA